MKLPSCRCDARASGAAAESGRGLLSNRFAATRGNPRSSGEADRSSRGSPAALEGATMLSLGSGARSAKPSFVSYVTPEEIKSEKEPQKKERHPDLLPGEVVFCSANPVLKHTQDDVSQRGIFGTLLCTNFRVSFISDEAPQEETTQHFRNKLYGENDIPLMCVDHVYGVYDEKKKLITGSFLPNKYPSKMIIHCKDLRVFQFCLTYTKEEDARKIFRGIVHHCLEPKSLKCVFAFSYSHAARPERHAAQKTVMFDSPDDWMQEMKRTKGTCRITAKNENFELSTKLPKYFIIPAAITDQDLDQFPGNGLPIWCWSHHSGCALFKSSSVPTSQEDGVVQTYMERMLQAVAQNHLYSVKTEDLSETLPAIQDIQQSYTKFKQFFLIDNSTDFWVSDVKWFSSLESSGWLDIIRQCLHKAVEVVECLEKENTNVLIMEEEGTDLCCVISSLVQIMLDPHYRTLAGFQGLVQKEWVAGCHAFLDRCNHLHQKDKECQSPVFLLFLECVWQLVQQHSAAFQFSETYLTVLSDSVHVPVFSTFLFNSAHQRENTMKAESQYSQRGPLTCPAVWDWSVQFDCKAQQLFLNPLYSEKLKQERTLRKSPRGKHQRQLSLPSSAFKTPLKKGFFKDETDSLKKLLRVKRLSRWMVSPESSVAGSTSEFYEAWQRRPPDPHGLLLPCLSGPAMRLWTQRCLRWIPDSQIVGGGSVAVTNKLAELLAQVQELQSELEGRGCWDTQSVTRRLQPRPIAVTRASVRLSSSFPFASGRSWCSKPAIPTSLLHSLMVSDKLASQDDESSEVLSFV
ncbi:myotubularin-related protein 12 isoform X2 [Neoarius graeffei]|uniref:myotubularin-related protein 12 isoform X2 n=1 Tax=Neoarius graeffei TaxID=443677 RepID=UPI00298BCB45|nr:myotubularin-related protein 12 isoform X2 [Neoarius graeffei]